MKMGFSEIYWSYRWETNTDAEYDFIYVNIGANGRAGGAAIWNECSFREALEQNTLNLFADLVCVEDEAFPLKTYLLKPYSKRNSSRREKSIQLPAIARTTHCKKCIWDSHLQIS